MNGSEDPEIVHEDRLRQSLDLLLPPSQMLGPEVYELPHGAGVCRSRLPVDDAAPSGIVTMGGYRLIGCQSWLAAPFTGHWMTPAPSAVEPPDTSAHHPVWTFT